MGGELATAVAEAGEGDDAAPVLRPGRRSACVALGLFAAFVVLGFSAGPADADIYWASLTGFGVNFTNQETYIGHANQDGTGVNSQFAPGAPHGLVVAGEYLYGTLGPSIAREKINGTGIEPEFIVLPGEVKDAQGEYRGESTFSKLAVEGEYIYWASCHIVTSGPLEGTFAEEGEIGRAKLNGTEITPNFIRDDSGLDDNCIHAVAADEKHLYWSRVGGSIARANLNGTGVELEYAKGVTGDISGLAVNARHIYWNTLEMDELGRANINGGEVNNSFIKLAGSKLDGGLALDEQHLFWAAETVIGRANLEGGEVEEAFIPNAVAPEDHFINGVAVTPAHPPLAVTVTALSKGDPWSTQAEGVRNPLTVKVTIQNPASASEGVTGVTPSAIAVSAPGALTSTGPPTPAPPAGGWTLAPGASVSFTEPYQIAEPGQATISDSVTWTLPSAGPRGPVTGMVTTALGSGVSGAVYGQECGAICRVSGLANQTILVTGRASDGTAISKLATSGADGKWGAGVPAGVYTVGPSNDGATITGEGFTPEQASATVTSSKVEEGRNFQVCVISTDAEGSGAPSMESQLDALTVGVRSGDLRYPVARLASGTACAANYSFTVYGGIPISRFVDPSSRAPYAVFSNGEGYRANNHAPSSNWYEQMPACPSFESHGTEEKFRPLKWLTFYNGNGTNGLGSATVNLSWDRHNVKLEKGIERAGTLTRVFDYEEHGHKGRCVNRRGVVPSVFTRVDRVKSTFETMISWAFPFGPTSASGGETPRIPLIDGLVEKAAEAAYEKFVEHHISNGDSPLVKTASVYVMTEGLVHAGFHFASHKAVEAAAAGAVAMLEELTELETKANTAQILADAIDAYAGPKFGYETMDVVVRGKFESVSCPGTTYSLYCDDTRLAIDASSDRFPQYRLYLTRYGAAVPTATDLSTKVGVVSGGDAAHLPEVNSTDPKDYDIPGTTGAEAALDRALKVIRPNALEFANGAQTSGNIPKALPYCTEKGLAATPSSICFTFADNRS